MTDTITDNTIAGCLARWREQRDAGALGELLRWQRDRAYAVAYRILGHGADAEDAVQQAFLKLLSRTHGFATPGEFRVAVYRAVVQCALDMARANRVRANLENAMSRIEQSPSASPQSAAEREEAVRLVFEELAALPEQERALVVLCYQEGLSVSDAAEVLDVPRETLRSRLARSMEDLRGRLKRRGVLLSLLLLAGVLKEGAALAAPPALCEAMDLLLPGAPCAEVLAATPSPAAPSVPLATPLFSTSRVFAASAAALVLFGVGVWYASVTSPWRARSPRTGSSSNDSAAVAGDTARLIERALRVKGRDNRASGPAAAAQPVSPSPSPARPVVTPEAEAAAIVAHAAANRAAKKNPKRAQKGDNQQLQDDDEIALANLPRPCSPPRDGRWMDCSS